MKVNVCKSYRRTRIESLKDCTLMPINLESF